MAEIYQALYSGAQGRRPPSTGVLLERFGSLLDHQSTLKWFTVIQNQHLLPLLRTVRTIAAQGI
jgi:hypothetical protein